MNNSCNCETDSDSDESTSEEDSDYSEDEQDSREPRSTQGRRRGRRKHHRRKKIVWPPPSNATPTTSTYLNWNLKPLHIGNPKLGDKMQLFSQTGHHLAIYADGEVRGTKDENDLHTYLEIQSGGDTGLVRIYGLLVKLYITMDSHGGLYGQWNRKLESTVFIEAFQASYNTYLSKPHAHSRWYIGIQRNGKIKRGPRTGFGQKAIKFLPRRSRFE
ncbi:unnamed protein product [Diabrotica balteata]|uniref:Fibroblast growth factor n=1 Tax=Diabrotica balteata TaxID=107213 RepID=A0A9N9XCM4_DIABA|nr:unnamed protein product [Diabrotica balteata]